MEIEDERGEHVARRAAKAELRRPKHGRGRVGGLEFAINDFLADGGPADFAAKFDAQAALRKQPEVVGDGERRGVR